ncbi:MAG: Dipeptide transport system permease protein DppC [Labilithrix sp.]|nr:Dipeptide transport system permease protein DppC [Labilithrix sp.]
MSSDHPDARESIPLLLSVTTRRPPRPSEAPPAAPPPPPTPLRVASDRADGAGALGYLRSWLGAAGTLIAALLVLCAVFADVLASDLPIACTIHGSTVLFANVRQPADLVALGPERIAEDASFAVWPVVRHGPERADREPLPKVGPRTSHPFGTDVAGRDVFARVVHGTRTYFVFALAAVLASLLLGGALGSVAGLFGGATDTLVGRAIETVTAFPPLVLVLGIQAAVPRATVATLFFAIALTRWPEVARLVRAEVLQISTREYVLAARALGASPLRILLKHVAPNVRGQLGVLAAVGMPSVILLEASLDFLRVAAPVGSASWGETMSEFRDAHGAWWLLLFPGIFLLVTVAASTLLGEARREALDPRSR